ncbi:MAG: metallophosphoesterase [Cyclobacteriaceae bacterium]
MIKLYPIFIFLLVSCQQPIPEGPEFKHEISSEVKPWTNEAFQPEEEDFTFAIVSDLTGGERAGVYSSAVQQLNRLDPAFVTSVGDLIEGGTTDLNQLRKEWDSFASRTNELEMPFFYIGGNHDLTNPSMLKYWQERFGPLYYHFVYEDVLFLMMDSEDYGMVRMNEVNEARNIATKMRLGEIEGNYRDSEYFKMQESKVGGVSLEQQDYFKDVITKNEDVKWTILFMHKPLWKRTDSLGLGKIEEALSNRPFTVFNGHEHSFSHRKRNSRDYTILGTTGGWQDPNDSMAFDHITLVRMAEEPVITHLKMAGILDEKGQLPEGSELVK